MFTGFIQSLQRLQFEVNSSNKSDIQCYLDNVNIDFTSGEMCNYFTNCENIVMVLMLSKSHEGDHVSVIEERSTLEIVVQRPQKCSCSEPVTSSTVSDAVIAVIVLSVLVVIAILAITVLVVAFYCRRKKGIK